MGNNIMNNAERKMLEEAHDSIADLRAAFLDTPAGSPTDDKPLLEDIRIVVRAYKRASWLTRALIWILPAIAGVGVAVQTIRGWLS